jgi:formimidoylglutamase
MAAFVPHAAQYPALRVGPSDPRFLELQAELEAAHLLMAGVPYDASVLGRKGARKGPQAIREALRFLSTHDPAGIDLARFAWHDLGDVAGLDEKDVLATHATVRRALQPAFSHGKPVVLLGGDHGLTYAHVAALWDHVQERDPGRIGIVVLDAHYDLRGYDGQPSSGTPFRRILEELPGAVRAENLVEIGIRPYANTKVLADYAAKAGVRIHAMRDVRRHGIESIVEQALEQAGDGTEHLWLSIDIDGLDQSIAPGCSAPGAGGLSFEEADHVVRAVATDSRLRAMDVLEVAPELDPTGNTVRVAAQLVVALAGGIAARTSGQRPRRT